MRALEFIDSWNAEHVAAGVIDASGAVSTRGDIDEPFALASVTKLLSAFCTLIAIEEGTIGLGDAAGPPGSTIEHLLAHASGLGPNDPSQVLAAPGTRRIYSNAGYELLASTVAEKAEMDFAAYMRVGLLEPLGMFSTHLSGSAARDATGTVRDLLFFCAELLSPHLIDGKTLHHAVSVAFPGLAGVLPGFGYQHPCDWGLGFELKDAKAPHWTGARNSAATFGHFGRSGTFLWVDPEASVALVALSDFPFGTWAGSAWPAIADAVLVEHGACD